MASSVTSVGGLFCGRLGTRLLGSNSGDMVRGGPGHAGGPLDTPGGPVTALAVLGDCSALLSPMQVAEQMHYFFIKNSFGN